MNPYDNLTMVALLEKLQTYDRYKNKNVRNEIASQYQLKPSEVKKPELLKALHDVSSKQILQIENMDPLLAITTMNIDYINNLDYVDISQLSRVTKNFNNKNKFNEILTTILLQDNNKYTKLFIHHKYDIVGVLDELYNTIEKIININYKQLPAWVNKEDFINYMKRRIINGFVIELSLRFELFSERNGWGEGDQDFFEDNMEIKINKYLVAIPFIGSDDNDLYFNEFPLDNQILYGVVHTITLSENIINYIEPSLMKHQNHNTINEILDNLFFVKDYVTTYI